MSTHTVLDLFCGCGGLSLGLEAAGFEVVGGNDFDDDALTAFALNHPKAHTWPGRVEDLQSTRVLSDLGLAPGELDSIVGGPPCQGFSQNRARRHVNGRFVDDPRNYLFAEFLRFVSDLKPKTIVIENVPQLLIKENGAFKREIQEQLSDLGYESVCDVLNAADYGVPQRRRRAIILASRVGPPALPSATHQDSPAHESLFPLKPYVSIWEAIGDLPSLDPGQGTSPMPYGSEAMTSFQLERRHKSTLLHDHVAWELSNVQAERLTYLEEGDGMEKLPPHLAPRSGYGSAYRRMRRDEPALTITTWMYHPGSGMFCHPRDDRVITLREGARLQSFDDHIRFAGGKVARCRQVGNAVPPLLGRALGGSLKNVLKGNYDRRIPLAAASDRSS